MLYVPEYCSIHQTDATGFYFKPYLKNPLLMTSTVSTMAQATVIPPPPSPLLLYNVLLTQKPLILQQF